MVKLNKNVLNVEWENKMNIRDILKIVLWILFALAVFMIIVGSILDKKKIFNNNRYLTIFKDIASILIIPLLANMLNDDKITFNQFIGCAILIFVLMSLYLCADWLFIPNTSSKNIDNKKIKSFNVNNSMTYTNKRNTVNETNSSNIKRDIPDTSKQTNIHVKITLFSKIFSIVKLLSFGLLIFTIVIQKYNHHNTGN